MTHNVSIEEARNTLSDLVLEARNGDEVFLTQDNTPIVKLVPLINVALKLNADRTLSGTGPLGQPLRGPSPCRRLPVTGSEFVRARLDLCQHGL